MSCCKVHVVTWGVDMVPVVGKLAVAVAERDAIGKYFQGFCCIKVGSAENGSSSGHD